MFKRFMQWLRKMDYRFAVGRFDKLSYEAERAHYGTDYVWWCPLCAYGKRWGVRGTR